MKEPLFKAKKDYKTRNYIPRPKGYTFKRKTKSQLLDEHIRLNDTLTMKELADMSYSYMIDKILKQAEKRNKVLITKIAPDKWVIER